MNRSEWTKDLEDHFRQQVRVALPTQNTPEGEAAIQQICQCCLEKLKLLYLDPASYKGSTAEEVVAILVECVNELKADNPTVEQVLQFDEWEVLRAAYLNDCLAGVEAAHMKVNLNVCLCQFNYLKSKCQSIADWDRLTLQDFAEARNQCTD